MFDYKTLIILNNSVYGGDGLAFYDSSLKYVSGYSDNKLNGEFVALPIPNTAKYFRVGALEDKEILCYLVNFDYENIYNSIRAIKIPTLYSTDSIINGKYNELSGMKDWNWVTDSNVYEIDTTPEQSGNTWYYLNTPIVPDFNNICVLEFDAKLGANHSELGKSGLRVWLTDGRIIYDVNTCTVIERIDLTNEYVHYRVEFDPTYYTVYKEPAWNQFNIWFETDSVQGCRKNILIKGAVLYQISNHFNYKNIRGYNVKELFESLDQKLSSSTGPTNSSILVSPNGDKYELTVDNTGLLTPIPLVPTKATFFGNSLLTGSGYGMAASDSEHDYYHLINECITKLKSSYNSKKVSGVSFEGCDKTSDVNTCVNSLVSQLDGDETLVVIQLGDNVNTTEKVAVFKDSVLVLCKAIRNKCPKARVVWMGMWYGTAEKYNYIQMACEQTGCKFISFADLLGSDANSKIGNVQKKAVTTRTLTGVTNVTENTNTNITVKFTVSGATYTSTLDVQSWSMIDTILTYTGEYEIITSGGVASHPGDEGFRRIANKFLYEMGIVDVKEYYTKSELGI